MGRALGAAPGWSPGPAYSDPEPPGPVSPLTGAPGATAGTAGAGGAGESGATASAPDRGPGGHRLGAHRGPVAVGDGHATVLAEGLGGDAHAGGHLAPLVLGSVDQAHHLFDHGRVEAVVHQL